jgi:hypothetical protein
MNLEAGKLTPLDMLAGYVANSVESAEQNLKTYPQDGDYWKGYLRASKTMQEHIMHLKAMGALARELRELNEKGKSHA